MNIYFKLFFLFAIFMGILHLYAESNQDNNKFISIDPRLLDENSKSDKKGLLSANISTKDTPIIIKPKPRLPNKRLKRKNPIIIRPTSSVEDTLPKNTSTKDTPIIIKPKPRWPNKRLKRKNPIIIRPTSFVKEVSPQKPSIVKPQVPLINRRSKKKITSIKKEVNDRNQKNNRDDVLNISENLVPLGIRYKIPLSRDVLKTKQNNLWTFSAIPSPYYNPLYGLGIGLASFFSYYGCDPDIDYSLADVAYADVCLNQQKDIFYDYSPYLYQVSALTNIFFRSGIIEYQKHQITFDAPYLAGTMLRMYFLASYEENHQRGYHGYGDDSLNSLVSPLDQSTHTSYSNYRDSLDEIDDDGLTYTRYNQYFERLISVKSILSYNVIGFIRLYAGVGFFSSSILEYTDTRVVNRVGEEGDSAETQLSIDCANNLIVACTPGGYFDLPIIIGFTVDWRDFEQNTQMGILIDTALEISSTNLLSSFSYVRYYIAPHFYVNPFITLEDKCNKKRTICFPTRLVFAVRLLYSTLDGEAALYTLSRISTEFENHLGLGGSSHLRGYVPGRFIGKTIMYGVLEARWSFLKLHPGLLFTITPFFEVGRVFSDPFEVSFRSLRFSYGVSFDVGWNESMTYRFQYALSPESAYFSLNIGYVF